MSAIKFACLYYVAGERNCTRVLRRRICLYNGDDSLCPDIDSKTDNEGRLWAVKLLRKSHDLPQSIIELFTKQ